MIFTKQDGKYDLLEIVRADSSVERIDCPKQGIIPHDMVHYAVEKELGARGFMRAAVAGEASGYAPMSEVEAEAIERLVETMQADAWGAPGTAGDLLDLYRMTCEARGHASIAVEPASIDAIKDEMTRLQLEWDEVPAGGTMELSF
ncbi:hypothetical protein ACFSCW_14030 [Sphingomonas tabacisoli]|uniref:Uncharacterized protein n=1 Tax=Sphingomonas tabacisoli TaxID=2249466 RepID=A0ABW4I7X4_9SPHN